MSATTQNTKTAEHDRLAEDARRDQNWKRWGPYLAERQWGTVREDYSPDGSVWTYFPFDHARSRVYRWGEDGLLGLCDRECRMCFSVALWNEKDPILKERLFGLGGHEGNHGEDVKELYYYLDATPTHIYNRALYKYPQAAFPYQWLRDENKKRGKDQPEFELWDTGMFSEGRYFDVQAEFAKDSPNDILIRLTLTNQGPEAAPLHVLPTLWYRNTWIWGNTHEITTLKPRLDRTTPSRIDGDHETLGRFAWHLGEGPDGKPPELLFTENETNYQRLYQSANGTGYVKDAFHDRVIGGKEDAVNPKGRGTKAAAWYRLNLKPGQSIELDLRLHHHDEAPCSSGHPLQSKHFGGIFDQRRDEAEAFYKDLIPDNLTDDHRLVCRRAYAGLLWTKQFYHYIVEDWLEGDPAMPAPPEGHREGPGARNTDWRHVFSRDVLSMPDKWEYPWFAAWDLGFHMIPFCRIDPHFAKKQLGLLLREWYMHPNGQIPAYEFNFSDVNPPVHAWACWRVYKLTAPRGQRDASFLASMFQKLLMNFTWWVNQKDPNGNHVFNGGFLGLDNIGIFDRSQPLPSGQQLTEADATGWMAFYCTTMLAIALELAEYDTAYADMASKFFEHFVAIADAINTLGGTGLWDDDDRFYYDQVQIQNDDGSTQTQPIRIRSLVGLIPLIAVEVLEQRRIDRLPGFKKRMDWLLENQPQLARHISCDSSAGEDKFLLAIPSRDRLESVLAYMLDEDEFLSPFGLRSLSKYHQDHPYRRKVEGQELRVDYEPGESTSEMFGGNSNWRGPIWMPTNFLIIEALQRYHHFFGDELTVECPTGSGNRMNLDQVAVELQRRLARLFDAHRDDPNFTGLIDFHEYFHAETGQGLGASHQTGWTSLIAQCLENLAKGR